MSILLFIESENNKLKRNAAEIASYGVALADKLNKDCVAVSFNADNAQELEQFGISKVFNVTNTPQQFDAHVYANVLTHYVAKLGVHILLLAAALMPSF
jgi:electron transfer flavoprotein alpha subunit